MPKYIALLRGINVGGKTVKMTRLKDMFEGLGFTGKGQGIAAYAVSLIEGNILQYATNLFKR